MSVNAIDAKLLTQMFLCGAKELEDNKEHINELNVFPVPDGDTGTNMSLTILSAAREVNDLGDASMKDINKAMSSGSLRGARGNSGVILSQLIRGFGKVARSQDTLTAPVIADAFERARDTAYKAVMKPMEGTILTVAREAAEKCREVVDSGEEDLDVVFQAVLEAAEAALNSTPELLPVLKQAGVVDSGGAGLLCVLKGAYAGFGGKVVDFAALTEEKKEEPEEAPVEEPQYLYKEKFTIYLKNVTGKAGSRIEKDLTEYINSVGTGLVCMLGSDRISVSVNTNDPALVLQKALIYGDLARITIDNVVFDSRDEGEENAAAQEEAPAAEEPVPEEPRKPVGFITVAVGDGIAEIFTGLGVDYIISGGQTMNPSTDDILKAVDKVNADTIFVMPNNKNIVMAANQAASLCEDKKLVVIPTKTIPQGITAVISYTPDLDADANKENMMEEVSRVKTAEITYAVRDTEINDIQIHQGDYMGIADKGIVSAGPDREVTIMETMRKIVDDETEIISVYYGADVTAEEAEALADQIRAEFESCDVEVQKGGQPIYYYILSAE